LPWRAMVVFHPGDPRRSFGHPLRWPAKARRRDEPKTRDGTEGVASPAPPRRNLAFLRRTWQQIAKLEEGIDRLQRTEEAIVVATDGSREAGCPTNEAGHVVRNAPKPDRRRG
jgi:hypothetical protein